MLRGQIRFERGAVWLPRLGLWLDPQNPQRGPERVFISHAHSDHVARHREVILTPATAAFLRARQAAPRIEQALAFSDRMEFGGADASFHLTLLPAGHIFGSAMAYVETAEGGLLYTGDFKLRPSLSAEICEPRHADVLIMETTYGRAAYRFPPTDEVVAGVVRFCRQVLEHRETPVLLGYALGKSQELIQILGGAGLPLMLHERVLRMTRIYEQLGQRFPPYEPLDLRRARAKVLFCPPGADLAELRARAGALRLAVLTGWAAEPRCRFRNRADAAFPLSDHADFPDLLEMVRQVNPKKVYTLHGFAVDFARTLRELGFDAQALGCREQLDLPLALGDTACPTIKRPPGTPGSGSG